MGAANFLQHCQIECPLCGKAGDHLTVWRNVRGTPYCACDDCIRMELDDPSVHKARLVETLLRLGFRTGFEAAKKDAEDAVRRLKAEDVG